MGSPTPSISGMTHLRSNAFASTILKIFCTLMEAEVEQKTSDACMALAKRLACGGGGVYLSRCHGYWGRKEERKKSGRTCFVISSCSSRGNVANWSNLVPMRKGIAVCTIIREGEKEINRVFRIFFFYKKKNSPGSKKKTLPDLVKPPRLAIPLFHRIQGRFSWKIKHEENSNSIIAHERKHIHKLSLTA